MVSSYSVKQVTKMIDIYTDNPCLEVVDKLSVLFNRPRKSIISKLVKEGVYQRKGYKTKLGGTPITKLQVCRNIAETLDTTLPGLDKAPKTTLIELEASIIDMSNLLEESLFDLQSERVREDIFDILHKK